MTNFIDLIYCSGLDDGQAVLACAPMSAYIKKGDIVCIDGMTEFYMVLCQATVAKGSDIYKLIAEMYGNMCKVTDKYSHQEIDRPLLSSGIEDSDYE